MKFCVRHQAAQFFSLKRVFDNQQASPKSTGYGNSMKKLNDEVLSLEGSLKEAVDILKANNPSPRDEVRALMKSLKEAKAALNIAESALEAYFCCKDSNLASTDNVHDSKKCRTDFEAIDLTEETDEERERGGSSRKSKLKKVGKSKLRQHAEREARFAHMRANK